MTDFTLNQKTGDIKQVGTKDDKPDRILKTDSKGNIKKKGEGFLGFLVSKSHRGEAKVGIDGIQQGILKDGMNFQKNSNVIDVGGKGQPTAAGVEDFALKLANYIDKEVGGYELANKGQNDVSHIYFNPYEKNTPTEEKGGFNLNSAGRGDLVGNVDPLVGFHTHLSRFSENERLNPSEADLKKKGYDQASGVKKFIILTPPEPIEY